MSASGLASIVFWKARNNCLLSLPAGERSSSVLRRFLPLPDLTSLSMVSMIGVRLEFSDEVEMGRIRALMTGEGGCFTRPGAFETCWKVSRVPVQPLLLRPCGIKLHHDGQPRASQLTCEQRTYARSRQHSRAVDPVFGHELHLAEAAEPTRNRLIMRLASRPFQ